MRTRLERLLNYKRYIDYLVDKELENVIKRSNRVGSAGIKKGK